MSAVIKRREFIQRSVTGFLGASIVFTGNRAQAQISGRNKKPFKGIFPIMQTPFLDDETIDTECLRKEVNFIVEAGGHGLMAACFILDDPRRPSIISPFGRL